MTVRGGQIQASEREAGEKNCLSPAPPPSVLPRSRLTDARQNRGSLTRQGFGQAPHFDKIMPITFHVIMTNCIQKNVTNFYIN